MVKILYAEDDAMQARTCIDYLKRAGYKVVHAADGEQALWLYRRETPDLILMDVIMPKMSGFEVAKNILNMRLIVLILERMTTSVKRCFWMKLLHG